MYARTNQLTDQLILCNTIASTPSRPLTAKLGIFKMQLVQISVLAFPAMITASAVTAALLYAANPAWSFWACWLMGIISAATDPVAVVALLKDLGASKALGSLIEGESLLNDGSAVVLFTWVRNTIGYASNTVPN